MREKWSFLKLAVAVIALTSTAAADFYACGDTDGNGSINAGDAIYLLNYIFDANTEPLDDSGGDYNSDGKPNLADCVYLIAYIFYGGPEPTCPYGTVTDIDGNVYRTIKIGDQWWMAENLKVTGYRNGDPIPNVTDDGTWWHKTGAYCNYNNDEGHVAVYGRLYNWYAVGDSRGITPEGWHVPTDVEWKRLEMYLGMNQADADTTGWRGTDEGGKLKETGTTHWYPPNEGATDESGFSALPGGYRYSNGYFGDNMGFNAAFWSSTESSWLQAWLRGLYCNRSEVFRDCFDKRFGFSIRCVKD